MRKLLLIGLLSLTACSALSGTSQLQVDAAQLITDVGNVKLSQSAITQAVNNLNARITKLEATPTPKAK